MGGVEMDGVPPLPFSKGKALGTRLLFPLSSREQTNKKNKNKLSLSFE